jgi:hypothetical protein
MIIVLVELEAWIFLRVSQLSTISEGLFLDIFVLSGYFWYVSILEIPGNS